MSDVINIQMAFGGYKGYPPLLGRCHEFELGWQLFLLEGSSWQEALGLDAANLASSRARRRPQLPLRQFSAALTLPRHSAFPPRRAFPCGGHCIYSLALNQLLCPESLSLLSAGLCLHRFVPPTQFPEFTLNRIPLSSDACVDW